MSMLGDELRDVEIRLAIARKASPFGVVKCSTDGRSIAATGGPDIKGDGIVWVWRLDGSEALLLKGHEGEVRDLASSPDGASLASGSYDKTVMRRRGSRADMEVLCSAWRGRRMGRAWPTDRQDRHAATHTLVMDFVLSVAWSPDGGAWPADPMTRPCGCGMRRRGTRVTREHAGDQRGVVAGWGEPGQRIL